MVEKVQIRVRKDDSNFYVIERKVGSEKWRKLPSQIRSKYLKPDIFNAWRLEKTYYEVYDPRVLNQTKFHLLK